MAAIETPTSPSRERRLRAAGLVHESVEPTPEEVRQFGCPIEDCEKQSSSMSGIRQHISIVHDRELNRATMECQECEDRYKVTTSKISSSAFCSRGCKSEFGVGGGVSGSPKVVDPPVPVEITTETRYPCPIGGCDVVCVSQFGLRKHATQMHDGRGRITLSCEECDRHFHVKAAEAERARFCSPGCMDESRRQRIEVACEGCGDDFDIRPNRLGTARFCSWKCSASWRAEYIQQFKNRTKYDLLDMDPQELGLLPIGERVSGGSIPYTGPIVDWRVDRDQCLAWRQTVLEDGDLATVADGKVVPTEIVRKHVTGSCEHGFDTSVAPVRFNGVEWTSTEVGSVSRTLRDPSRRGATFDG